MFVYTFYKNTLTFIAGRQFYACMSPMVASGSTTNYFFILPDLKTCN